MEEIRSLSADAAFAGVFNMGKMPKFTQEQRVIFNKIKETEFLRENFYFTGGTALSLFYLEHRYSEDLDFFSEKKFDGEDLNSYMTQWAREYNFIFKRDIKEMVDIFILDFGRGKTLKVDFGHYPYKRVEKGRIYEGMMIDSLLDIGINKLLSINQRAQVKDFVDLYFLLRKFTIWDLIEGVRVKFRMEMEPWILAADLLIINDFNDLPLMIKPLKLEKLKIFFRKKAKEMGKTAVEF